MNSNEREKAIAYFKENVEKIKGIMAELDESLKDRFSKTLEVSEIALETLEQYQCETIQEIPKDYCYDTETKDFLVYRNKYTGHEIHIEKPVPRYRLEQESIDYKTQYENYLKKSEVIISQLRADRDRLQKAIDNTRNKITELDKKVCQQFLIEDVDKEVHHTYQECLKLIDKYSAEVEG